MNELRLERPDFGSLRIGATLPPLELPPVSRATLALYAGASGDHNPNHIDVDAARAAGYDDVFAHGMLVMAYLGRLLTNWVPQESIRQFDVRFTDIVHVHDRLTCSGHVIGITDDRQVSVELRACDQHGHVKATGKARIDFS
jgi:acyl dehydratase